MYVIIKRGQIMQIPFCLSVNKKLLHHYILKNPFIKLEWTALKAGGEAGYEAPCLNSKRWHLNELI